MGNITNPNIFTAGAVIIASEHNANFNTIYNEFNGNIENVNIKSNAAIAASKLNLSTISQAVAFANTVTMTSKILKQAKGGDVASSTSITLGDDGNFFDITGTTDIETITAKQAGTVVWLQFDGALNLIDNSGNLELNGSNIPVSAEDVVCLVCDGTNWVLASNIATNLSFASQAQGDIAYFDGTSWTRLGAGTSGYFLKTQGAGANPIWAENVSSTSNVIAQLPVQLGVANAAPSFTQIGESMYWEKNAEISTIYFKHKGKVASGSSYSIRLDVGGQNSTQVESSSPTVSTWRNSFSVDVSSLSDGTEYEIKILAATATTVQVDVDAFSMWGE